MTKRTKKAFQTQGTIILNIRLLQGAIMLLFALLTITNTLNPLLAVSHSSESPEIARSEDTNATGDIGEAKSVRRTPIPLTAVSSDDPDEENDDLASALQIPIGSKRENRAANGLDEDWYFVEIATSFGVGFTLIVQIQYDSTETDFDLEVGDRDLDEPLYYSNSSGPVDAIRFEIPSGMTFWHYYARIYVAPARLADPSYNDSQFYTYSLSMFLEDRFGNSFYECNNDTAHAADIPSVDNPTDFVDCLTLSSSVRINDTFRFFVWETNEVNITVGGDMPGGNMFALQLGESMAGADGLNASILDPSLTAIDNLYWIEANQTVADSMNFTADVSGYYYLHLTFTAPAVAGQAIYNFSLTIDDSIDGVGHTGSDFATAPIIRKGLAFDGVDDQVVIPDNSNLRLGTSMTIELWLKTSIVPVQYFRLVGKGTTYRNYGVWIHSGSKILWQIYSSGGPGNVVSTRAVTDGAWHHVAVTYNGSIMAIYIDGSLDASAAYTQTPYTSSEPLKLGYGDVHNYYEGFLDEVRILSWSLTAAMIREDFASSPTYPTRPATVAWYQFREGSGTTVGDNSGTHNNGMLEGGASLAFSETVTGLWTSSLYPDYYNISLYENEIFDLSIDFIHALGDINLYLYSDSGKTAILMGSTSHTDRERVSHFLSPQDATYYLFLNSTNSGQRYYNLSFTILTDDIYEENDEFLDPAPLSPRNSTYALFLDKSEADFFQIDLGNQDFLNVTISFNGSLGNLDLALFADISGEILATSSLSSGSREAITYTAPSPSSVVIKVYTPFGGEIAGLGLEYRLIISIVYFDDLFEDNDALESAYLIGEGNFSRLLVSDGDPDYYAVYLLENERFQVDLFYTYSAGDIDLWILNVSGIAIEKRETLTDNENVTLIAPQAGVYYIYVNLVSGIVNLYDIIVSYNERADAFEDNDHFDEAYPLEGGSYECVLRWGDPDYYNISIINVQSVEIYARFDRSLGNLTMAFYMPNGAIAATSEILSNTTEAIELSASVLPVFGIYSLKVSLNSTTVIPPLIHDLAISLSMTSILNTTIPPISTMPFPHPSRDFVFLPPVEFDDTLAAVVFVGGLALGGIGSIVFWRRRTGT